MVYKTLVWSLILVLLATAVSAECEEFEDNFIAGEVEIVQLLGEDITVNVIGVNSQNDPQTATISINGITETLQEGESKLFGDINVTAVEVQFFSQPVAGGGARLLIQSCNESAAVCGDGNLEGDEVCDNGNDNANSCEADYDETCNVCLTTCDGFFNLQGPSCGDTIKNGPEECDGDDGTNETTSCSDQCTLINLTYCGDGTIQTPNDHSQNEECDDGNTESDDGCSATCFEEINDPICGDGIVEGDEQCDGIIQVGLHQTCTNLCLLLNLTYCGDNITQPINGENGNETCDDGNNANNDGCSSICQTEEGFCGDGIVQSPNGDNILEECDGTAGIHQLCLPSCFLMNTTYCGDGIIQAPNNDSQIETCDDANNLNNDGCSAACQNTNLCSIYGLNQTVTTWDWNGASWINGTKGSVEGHFNLTWDGNDHTTAVVLTTNSSEFQSFGRNGTAFSELGFEKITFCNGQFCGDKVCNNGETCGTCNSDCGSCPAPSGGGGGSSGGGGGGGSFTPPAVVTTNTSTTPTAARNIAPVLNKTINSTNSTVIAINISANGTNETVLGDRAPPITGFTTVNGVPVDKTAIGLVLFVAAGSMLLYFKRK